ncbi:MAG TPA: DUF2795 domain-containing protein [Streptosporangiaceae bacterium]|jgi:hypothetical protein|nr:DUF2795 domain-containing protein [Streptosporangiaceae bacterium]
MAGANVEDVLSALRGVDFPAAKEDLIRAAQAAGASTGVIKALRAIPPVEYANREEVARSVPADPAADRAVSPARRAEQARVGGKPGLSERLREVPKPPIEEELDR